MLVDPNSINVSPKICFRDYRNSEYCNIIHSNLKFKTSPQYSLLSTETYFNLQTNNCYLQKKYFAGFTLQISKTFYSRNIEENYSKH